MKKALCSFLLCFYAILAAFGASGGQGTRRFGIFVGSNQGGRNRTTLRYAVSDARALSRVFTELGGIAPGDSVLLVEPSGRDLQGHIGLLRERVAEARKTHKRTEIVFYYSGHSDEEGLLLGRERWDYRELREQITAIPSDMRIVILDSCSSGAFTRAKGGVKVQPFLFDNSISTEGYAFLTSSSATEASQESDVLGGSYFTHNLLAGLRGAADTLGDGRITLNELYRYAYAETLARTELSRYGAQHPSYDMRMSGTGDMVLTDLRETSAGLVIHEQLSGRLSIRDASDYLVAEINKTPGKSTTLSLEPGQYRIILQRGDVFAQTEIALAGETHSLINPGDFQVLAAAPAAARGAGEAEEAAPVKPVNIQVVPGLGFIGFDQKADNYVFLALLSGLGYNLKGFGLGGIGLSNTGLVRGLQLSGIYHTVRRDMYGLQAVGIFNLVVEDTAGAQLGGIANITAGRMRGAQVGGIFNWAGEGAGMQAGGIANIAGGDFRGFRIGGIANVTAGSFRGFQMGGIAAITGGDLRGVQLGTIANVTAGSSRGLQMGLVNYNGGGEGLVVMVGLVNVSKNEKAIPIGLVNVVKNGLFHPAVWYDDLTFVNLSLKSGSKYVYSILSVGVENMNPRDGAFITRLGLGTELPLKKAFADFDLTVGNIFNAPWEDTGGSSLLAQARLSLGFKLFKHLGAFAGLSYDYIFSPQTGSPRLGRDFGFSALSWGDGRHTHKIGFFGGIQF
jgi:hypothetical protein